MIAQQPQVNLGTVEALILRFAEPAGTQDLPGESLRTATLTETREDPDQDPSWLAKTTTKTATREDDDTDPGYGGSSLLP